MVQSPHTNHPAGGINNEMEEEPGQLEVLGHLRPGPARVFRQRLVVWIYAAQQRPSLIRSHLHPTQSAARPPATTETSSLPR